MCAGSKRAYGRRCSRRSRKSAVRRRRSSSTPPPPKRIAPQRAEKGRQNQAIGRSRAGRITKIHALTDAQCRLLAFMPTGGQITDCTAGAALLERLPDCEALHADKGYDANAIRRQVEERGALPNIPPKANRKWKHCFSPFLYRNRNAIERMFCRLKDFRRVATRYDRNTANWTPPKTSGQISD